MENHKRPETGPMQFGEDWPGIFIRGDNAIGISMNLTIVADFLREAGTPRAKFSAARVDSLIRLLRSCDATTEITGLQRAELKA